MKPTLRWGLLVVVCWAVLTNIGLAAPILLDQLDEKTIREAMKRYLEREQTKKTLEPIQALVKKVDPDQIFYKKTGDKIELVWKYEPVAPAAFMPEERRKVEDILRRCLLHVFGDSPERLLNDADARLVLDVAKFEPAGAPAVPVAADGELERLRKELERLRKELGEKYDGLQSAVQGNTNELVLLRAEVERLRRVLERRSSQPNGNGSGNSGRIEYRLYPVYGPCGMYYQMVPVYSEAPSPKPSAVAKAPPARVPERISTAPRIQEKVQQERSPAPLPASAVAHANTPQLSEADLRVVRLVERRSQADAAPLFWRAVRLYWSRDYRNALDQLSAAVVLDGEDARFWYFKALCERALGDQKAARNSARRAAALDLLGLPRPQLVVSALERIQGADRDFLQAFNEAYTSREQALEVVRATAPRMPTVPGTAVAERKPADRGEQPAVASRPR